MIRCNLTTTNPAFCVFEDWYPYLSDDLKRYDESYWRARSGKGTFAPFFKFGSQKTKAYWKRTDIFAHLHLMLQTLRPDLMDALRKAGFGPAKLQSSMPQPRKRKRRVNQPHRRNANEILMPKRPRTKKAVPDAV